MNYAIKVLVKDEWVYMKEGSIDDMRVSVMTLEEADEVVSFLYDDKIQIVEYNP